jgi:HD-GYP domain-containing protein (c-di-GMP phosphodiesterase class II)
MNMDCDIPVFIDTKDILVTGKIKQLKKIRLIFINRLKEIKNKPDGMIIDLNHLIKYHDFFRKSDANKTIKIFLIVPEGTVNDSFINEFYDLNIQSIILRSFSVAKFQKIIDRYITEIQKQNNNNELILAGKKQSENFNMLTEIGISLSVIRDIDVLFDVILSKSRFITNADAGSIYLVEESLVSQEEEKRITEKVLKFVHSQNFSFPIKVQTVTLPITKKSIVGYSALTGRILNISDAHKIPKSRDYSYSFENEKRMRVHNRSIIVVPMRNQKDEIVGVLQLFNKKKEMLGKINNKKEFDRLVIPFSKEDEEIVTSLASQAAVSLENNILYKEIKNIFEGFIKASVVAIEARDPTTSGHSERVAVLTRELAKEIGRQNTGIYKDVHFKDEDLKIIEYAGLLHDFGKIGVREKVLVKEKKLYPEELDLLKARYAVLKKSIINDFLVRKLDIIKKRGIIYFKEIESSIDMEMNDRLAEIEEFLKVIVQSNEPSIVDEDSNIIIRNLVNKKYKSIDGEIIHYLDEYEKTSLCIPKGNLTETQRKEIESHVSHSFKFLCNIPWTKEMASIPYIVYKHHEKLNGKGYPRKLRKDKIPLQARMMTIADIYDALTAADRPYKPAVKVDKALEILKMESSKGLIDDGLLRVFIQSGVYKSIRAKKN